MAIVESGHPTADVTRVKMQGKEKFVVGQKYELSGSFTFVCEEGIDGVSAFSEGLFRAISDKFDTFPYYWYFDYDYVVMERDGKIPFMKQEEGRVKWLIRSFKVQFKAEKIVEENPVPLIAAVVVAVLTSTTFWVGLGIFATFIIMGYAITIFVLKPIGEAVGKGLKEAGGVGAVLIVIVVLVLLFFLLGGTFAGKFRK